MSSFNKLLNISPLPDGKNYVLRAKLVFYIGDDSDSSTDKVVVKKGFVTDGASCPKIIASLGFTRWGRHGTPSVIHDLCYWTQDRTRKEADDIFLQGMVVMGVNRFKRWVIYRNLRMFGGLAWKNNAKLKAKHGEGLKYIDLASFKDSTASEIEAAFKKSRIKKYLKK